MDKTLFGHSEEVTKISEQKPSLISRDINRHNKNLKDLNNNANRSSVNRKRGRVSSSNPRDYKNGLEK